jgi:hypothetical protein
MANSKGPSAPVTAAGIIAIVGSVLTVLGVLTGLAGLLILPRLPQQPATPAFARTIAVAMMIFFLAVAVFGIFTGVGLLRLRNWARISALVWAGISVPLSGLVMLVFAVVPMPPPPNASANFIYFVRGFLLLFYGLPFGIGVWWLILFTRRAITDQFAAPIAGSEAISPGTSAEPLSLAPRTAPLPVTVLAWFFLVSSLSIGFIFLTHIPAVLFGYAIRGPAGAGIYAMWCLLYAASGIGLLRLKRWGYSLALGLQIVGLLSATITLLSPGYEAITRETMLSMNPSGASYPTHFIEHARAFASIGLLVPIVVVVILIYYRPRFLEACCGPSHDLGNL